MRLSGSGFVALRIYQAVEAMVDPEHTMDVRIRRIHYVATEIVSIELEPATPNELPSASAGSHVDVHVSDRIIRQYSVCNDPARSGYYRLAILNDPHSRGGSRTIHETFREGMIVKIGRPRNKFELVEDGGRAILLAGGIGITPLLSMAYRLQAIGGDFDFHLCVRTLDRAPFINEISAAPFAKRFRLHVDEGPADQRFQPERDLNAVCSRTSVYICGPKGFIDFAVSAARKAGCREDRIHTESFSAGEVKGGDAFTVVASRSGQRFVVPCEKSIASVLEENGVAVELSCEQGICGTCLTKVLKGRPEHRDSFQTDVEKNRNDRVAICCSRSLSDELVLDI
ncbi:PDR/VanB family oxidoreductase [Bradyrhizobium sp. CCBAU 53421]|uniref:PDR/VanB family oxidoreductase n=1 Tax=Bradyrhizobium sp. CCBAU 53421 TaxID=1325120 RepID=UPI00188A0A00|nr:PDR/VanB family oxidoreductase [Bradyrhizobium sp. CCBAU 53421]QOZ31660.1 oxidoreductase [Bradyrhizobium sp. CCBAU 53421]